MADDDCTLATVRTDPATGKVTQGVRIPNSAAALRVLRATGPLAATSANRSGDESAQTVDEAVQALGDAVDLYLDGGRLPVMWLPRLWRLTLMGVMALRFFERE